MYRVLPPYWGLEEFSTIFKKIVCGDIVSGDDVSLFNESLMELLNTPNVSLTSSGRNAIYLALLSMDLQPHSEVILPSFVCSETINPILQAGLSPRFVDIKDDMTIDPDSIVEHINHNTKVILMPHIYGKVCDYENVVKISKEYNLFLIDDAAPVMGCSVGRDLLGNFGDFGIYSMNYKSLYSLYGGAVRYNPQYKDKIDSIQKGADEHNAQNLIRNALLMCMSRIGYRFNKYKSKFYDTAVNKSYKSNLKMYDTISIEKMSNLTASIGLVQIKKHAEILKRRINNSQVLQDELEGNNYVHVIRSKNDFFIRFVLQLSENVPPMLQKRPDLSWNCGDRFRQFLIKNGVETLPVYTPFHLIGLKSSVYLPTTENIWKKSFIIPNNPLYDEEDMKNIAGIINSFKNRRV